MPSFFRHLEQNECSFDVCLDRRRRIIDAAIGVGLRSEMNYGIAIAHRGFSRRRIANVATKETIVGIICDYIKISEIARIG